MTTYWESPTIKVQIDKSLATKDSEEEEDFLRTWAPQISIVWG